MLTEVFANAMEANMVRELILFAATASAAACAALYTVFIVTRVFTNIANALVIPA
jgi:hypothetical protein